MVKDLRIGSGSGVPYPTKAAYGDTIHFNADDGIHGEERWALSSGNRNASISGLLAKEHVFQCEGHENSDDEAVASDGA
jgi:hypothetical protein